MSIVLFLLQHTFLVPSLMNAAPIFLRDILDPVFHWLSGPARDAITFLTCIVQKRKCSEMKEDILKRETPFFILKSLSNRQRLFFTS